MNGNVIKGLRDLLDLNNVAAYTIPVCLPASLLVGLTATQLAALTAIYNQVATYYTNLKGAYENKNNAQLDTGNHSADAETARINICNSQFQTLGTLIAKYYLQPTQAGDYFDLANIRTHSQTDFSHLVKPVTIIYNCSTYFSSNRSNTDK